MARITEPFHGAVLNWRHGEQTDEGLRIAARGTAPLRGRVTVNGAPARREGRTFVGEVLLTERETDIVAACDGVQGAAEHRVRVVASLPCYLQENVERQRGRGAYDASVEGLRRLNAVGYGTDPTLPLMLVFNPTGPSLPPPQESLEDDYRRELKDRFDLVFTGLWTIANMPIARWRHELERDGRLGAYLDLLVGSFNPGTIDGLMCRRQVNVDPCGRIFDCDFNQAIDLGAHGLEGRFVWEFDHDDLAARTIATGDHCYGCTAGAGSSCGGALA